MLCCLRLDKVLALECCRNLNCSGLKCAQRRLTAARVCSRVSEREKKQSSFSRQGDDKQGAKWSFLCCYGNAQFRKERRWHAVKLTTRLQLNKSTVKCGFSFFFWVISARKANRVTWISESILPSTDTVHNGHICQEKKRQKPHSWTQQSLKNSVMTLGEKEKSVIQQGVYIVIKSHVKKCKHTHHPLSLALSQHFLSELHKKKPPQILHLCSKQHTLILITDESILSLPRPMKESCLSEGVKSASTVLLNAAEISFKGITTLHVTSTENIRLWRLRERRSNRPTPSSLTVTIPAVTELP